MAKSKSWTEKLDNGRSPRVKRLARKFGGIPAGALMLISNPGEVQAMMRSLPAGAAVAPAELRKRLAEHHHADAACPVSTGIFMRIVAEAAWEEIARGAAPDDVTPFWRAIAPDSPLAAKLACGRAFVERMRRAEGIF
jgi:hypothetical protein